ncbi:MAG: AAA family ATPase [Acidobacteria bacterium]|nr:AAA family ATPase [Acidobacteriota bacterium]
MARLTGLIISEDERFRIHLAGLMRAGAIPVSVIERRQSQDGASADLVVVDVRAQVPSAMATIERLRAGSGSVAVFAVASESSPELILQAMRAGANEFFTWPPAEPVFHEAVGRTAARRDSSTAGRPQARVLAFFGAKGGAGTTTVAVNCGVELARLSKRPTVIVDLKPGLGEVALFLGLRSRYSLLDALDNLHRLDGEFLRELVARHKSGLEMLAGSDHFERPGAADSGAVEEVFRLLGRQYEYILVDAGSQIHACSVAALYTADAIYLVTNPDVPSVRNAQRLIDRINQLGACGERVRVLLNRAAEPYPIPPAQIEGAVGRPVDHTFPSDYKTVSAALNAGVPIASTGTSEIASQFDRFTRRILDLAAAAPEASRGALGLQRLASLW